MVHAGKTTLARCGLALLAAFAFSGLAYADKPDKDNGKGNSGKNKQEQVDRQDKQDRQGNKPDKGNKDDKADRGNKADKSAGKQQKDQGLNASISFGFGNDDIRLVRDYYGGQIAKGNCPPGLAKKGNGCQPPGQAKKWQRGQALGSDIRYYDIPNELRIRLPVPPINHRYVQYGTDLLLITVGTAIVVDAITDIF